MKTEIDQLLQEHNKLLIEKNTALTEQISSLKSILTNYSELEQQLENKINDLTNEKQAQQSLILAMKSELSNLEQSNFSNDLQQDLQANLQTQFNIQLEKALNQLDLNKIVKNFLKTELIPIQAQIGNQQIELEQALLKILQFEVPNTLYKNLEMQKQQMNTLENNLENLMTLVKKLDS